MAAAQSQRLRPSWPLILALGAIGFSLWGSMAHFERVKAAHEARYEEMKKRIEVYEEESGRWGPDSLPGTPKPSFLLPPPVEEPGVSAFHRTLQILGVTCALAVIVAFIRNPSGFSVAAMVLVSIWLLAHFFSGLTD